MELFVMKAICLLASGISGLVQVMRSVGLFCTHTYDSTVVDNSWFASWSEHWHMMDSIHKMVILSLVALVLVLILVKIFRGFGNHCLSGCTCGDKCKCGCR